MPGNIVTIKAFSGKAFSDLEQQPCEKQSTIIIPVEPSGFYGIPALKEALHRAMRLTLVARDSSIMRMMRLPLDARGARA